MIKDSVVSSLIHVVVVAFAVLVNAHVSGHVPSRVVVMPALWLSSSCLRLPVKVVLRLSSF